MVADGSRYVIGAGMSGLGAALALKAPVFEADSRPGGICHSVYYDETGARREPPTADASACFRFEPAGGHFLFSPDAAILGLLGGFADMGKYERRAVVFFPDEGRTVPFPLQEHLGHLDDTVRQRALDEIMRTDPEPGPEPEPETFRQWLLRHFGRTLCELFFFPFNKRYTAGLFDRIAPQDPYKSPIDRDRILAGADRDSSGAGYNAVFYYPRNGLDSLVRGLAAKATIHYGHCVERIDPRKRVLCFGNGKTVAYKELVSSAPLDRMLAMCGIETRQRPDPATAVQVVNVAAEAGPECPDSHWVYLPRTESGMHRVGFYSNVDAAFLPAGAGRGIVSLYAERGYPAAPRPADAELDRSARAMVAELQDWRFISNPILVRSSFVSPAYTWSWPGSQWVAEARNALADCGVRQIGRFGNWRFQGMADSFGEGWPIAP